MTLTRDDFEEWLAQMDDRLEALLARLPIEVAKELDFSPRSLCQIEAWMLSEYSSVRDLLAEENKEVLDEISSYVGEVFRRV